MKLANAKLYEEQIRRKMWEIWYDEKYQYYFGGSWRSDLSLADNNGDYQKRAFAVLNNKDELIGYISYSVDNELRIAQWFGGCYLKKETGMKRKKYSTGWVPTRIAGFFQANVFPLADYRMQQQSLPEP